MITEANMRYHEHGNIDYASTDLPEKTEYPRIRRKAYENEADN